MNSSKVEIFADQVYRNSIFIEKLDLSFSQFFVKSPSGALLCIETGMRGDFPLLKSNLLSAGIDVETVSGVIVPHFEADEMGALPEFISHNKNLVAYAHPICSHALADVFSVKTKPLKDEAPTTINGEVVIPIFTKHVHQWDALVIYLPRLKALFSSDIFMRFGSTEERSGDPVRDIVTSIEKSGYLPSIEYLHAALNKIKKYEIDSIFPMHGPAIHNDAAATINGLIEYCVKDRQKETVEG
ncbi:Beta-lactamase-like protein [Caballeronia sordidicola]|uniref:Beta-lactamase-like protein n=1 Tax=Caballeronia sordidicola TaxID=196367 RepID=A0A158HAG9_CABSO|nr:MBL fold metallo-hydrolase [Caballeronia sordidicola]SAL41412.1 Beta-lactamase-like protein [Caballeronia sordidicola]